MADQGLSGQDIVDLMQIRSKLPKGDARIVKIDTMLGTKAPEPPQPPGFTQSLGRALGAPTTPEEASGLLGDASGQMEGGKESTFSPPGGFNLPNGFNAGNAARNILRNLGLSISHGVKGGTREMSEAVQNVKAGQPILPNIGKSVSGLADILSSANPVINAGGQAGLQASEGNLPGAAGSAVGGLLAGAALGRPTDAAQPIVRLLKAEGNPNVVYHSYLDPVATTKVELPAVTPKVLRKIASELETESPELAARVKSGETTLGDLDRVRIAANRFAKAAYEGKNVPPAMAEGMRKLASDTRELIYPKIEELNGLPKGSLASIKNLEGDLLKAKIGSKYNPYAPSQWLPAAGAYATLKAQRGVIKARVRRISANLPAPQSDTLP